MSIEEIFNKYAPPLDYLSMIQHFDVDKIEPEVKDIIDNYRVPNRNYISANARDLNYENVLPSTLEYIINKCAGCSELEKYHASMVAIYKAYKSSGSEAAKEMKDYIVSSFSEPVTKQPSLAYLDQYYREDTDIFYFIQIQIGNNRILKYGITEKQPRKRFATLRSNIKEKYPRQEVRIDPIAIIQCSSGSDVEEEVKILMMENDFKNTNYYFEGHTETLSIKQLSDFKQLILEPVAEKFKLEVNYIGKTKTAKNPLLEPEKNEIKVDEAKIDSILEDKKNDLEERAKIFQQGKERDRQHMKSIHGKDWEPEQPQKIKLSVKEQKEADAYKLHVDSFL